jgi:hypothetical protein
MTTPQNRILIYGPKTNGSFSIEFGRQTEIRCRSLCSPAKSVLKYFQRLMPYGTVLTGDPSQ